MRTSSFRLLAASAIALSSAALIGCEVQVYGPPPPPPPPQPAVVVSGPVVDGGVVVDVLPPPEERVYVYDPGYPPGCFVYGGYVYYGGYRYQRDVFVNRYVTVNVRENRYVNIEENRRQGAVMEQRQRGDYIHNGGHLPPPDRGGDHHDEHHDYHY